MGSKRIRSSHSKEPKMKNTDVEKIRQLLTDHCEECLRRKYFNSIRKQPDACDAGDAKLCKISQALALLPCETCGGTKKKYILDKNYNDPAYAPPEAITVIPCPDCQSCPRCGGINGKHRQVDDPQAGNSNMLTKMQCPRDPKNPTYY